MNAAAAPELLTVLGFVADLGVGVLDLKLGLLPQRHSSVIVSKASKRSILTPNFAG